MNRKQFLILFVALVVLGGAGLALFWQDIAEYRESGAKIGAKLLPDLKIADVAEIRLRDAKREVTLVRKEKGWVVQERAGYSANFNAISDLMVKLIELKVTQSEQVAAKLYPRLDLGEPGKGEGAGTVMEFKDASGASLARITLGKTVLKQDRMNPLPGARDGVPAGRYVLPPAAKDRVVAVSDPLRAAEADPGKWLKKDFFKAERIRTLAVGPEGRAPQWKVTRSEEWGEWRFPNGGALDASAAVAAVNKLGSMSFVDIVPDPDRDPVHKATVAVAETFDNLTYRVRIAKRKVGDDYQVSVTVSGAPPRKRVPEKGEKPEDKENRDKDFAKTLKALEERIAAETALAKWAYIVAGSEVEPLLKTRSEMIAAKPPKK
ncbi:MAG: DUF4340 domain-containing protein [Betaproteobacteria bacterium]|nr:DUF4340 domain-containing protein [Betaproteobacteria bacterium]